MKYILLLICVLFAKNTFAADSFVLHGRITSTFEGYVYLFYNNQKDSTKVINNTFEFSGSVPFPCAAMLGNSSGPLDKDFYLENTAMQIVIDIEKEVVENKTVFKWKLAKFEGSKTEILRKDIEQFIAKNERLDNWNAKLFERLVTLSKQYPKNSYIGNLVYECTEQNLLAQDQINKIIANLDESHQAKFVIESLEIKASGKHVTKGTRIPYFKLMDDKAKWIDRKSIEGNYVLIEFWASWCGPCRKQFPELKSILTRFNNKNFHLGNKGFKIVGISIDDNKESWLTAIEKDQLKWINLNDKGGFLSKTAIQFSIDAVPANFLIDKMGWVIAVDISPQELESYLEKSLGK